MVGISLMVMVEFYNPFVSLLDKLCIVDKIFISLFFVMAAICSCSALHVHYTKSYTCSLANSPDHQSETPLLNKPHSIWVNPTKATPSVLTLQRHKRSSISYNPHIKRLRCLIKNLNDSSVSDLLHVLENYPSSLNGDDAFLVLNNLKSWQKTLLFFDWMKTRNLFPVKSKHYNVTMKSLRFGRQFQHIENLAFEMIHNRVELDNITYSTIITCAKRCNLYDKAIEWFERMYKTGLMPDEVTYSAVLDVYGKLRRVEEVVSLYERGRASGWKPDSVAFAVLGKLFAQGGDYDGMRYVFQEMKAVEVEPDLFLYNTLFEALIKAKKPGLAKGLYGSMISSGIKPNEKTLTALVRIFGKARWAKDALGLWEKMRSNKWEVDSILYNTLLNMCADLGLEEEAERLFEDMKKSEKCKPDSWSYTAMLNIYGSGGNAEKAMDLFDEMSELNVEINIMGCTCLIQCLGKARRIDDLVEVFRVSVDREIKPDDRLCGCLLSVVSYCEGEDLNKVLTCLEDANSKLVDLIKLLENEETDFNTLNTEFREILNNTSVDAQRPFCNCLIDICRNKNLLKRSHELLYFGLACNLYPGLHTKTPEEWRLNVRSLSVGAAHTALEDWISTLITLYQQQETLPELFSASTGAGTHKYSQGLANAFASHVNKLDAPFKQSSEEAGFFVASREDLVSWVQSRVKSATDTLNCNIINE